jgi:hypothetical protein
LLPNPSKLPAHAYTLAPRHGDRLWRYHRVCWAEVCEKGCQTCSGSECARCAVRCFRRPVVVCTDAGCVRFVWRENMEFARVKARSPSVSPEDPPNVASSRDVRWELSLIPHPSHATDQALRQDASFVKTARDHDVESNCNHSPS